MTRLTFIDIEASGFGAGSYPIEVGCAFANGQSYCTLIYPEPDWRHWDASAEAVHGIKRDILFEHGRASVEVADKLNEHLAGQVVITDAWYHDYTWLSRLFDAAERRQRFQLKDLRDVLNEPGLACWEQTKRQVTEELNLTRHRASNDARILQTTLQRVAELNPD
jgi:hypothetical protein